MKVLNILKFFLVLCLGMQLCSCSLDEELFGVPNPSAVETAQDIEVLVNGLYAAMNPYPFKLGIYALITTDDQKLLANNATAGANMLANRTYDATEPRVNLIWGNFYNMIGAANNLLEVVEEQRENIDEEVLDEAAGQAHFIRAFSYYYLVRLYGGVPIRTKAYNLEEEKFLPRSSVDAVYELIFDDFEKAASLLSAKTATSVQGKATKEAAQGMLASAALTYANYLDYNNIGDKDQCYQKAKDYAGLVINAGTYKLVDDYAALWDVANEAANYQTEVIFGIQYTRDPFDNTRVSLGSMFASEYSPTQTNYSGTPVGWYPVQPYVLDIYNYESGEYKGDYRIKTSFYTSWTGRNGVVFTSYPQPRQQGENNGVYPYIAKYRDDGARQFNAENDMYILRMSEIYLIYAEAENELNGPTPAAYEAFNKLRERARKMDPDDTYPRDLAPVTDKFEFRMAVFHERGLEFVGEDIKRFFDLVRMNSRNGDPMLIHQVRRFLPAVEEGVPVWNNAQQRYTGGRKTGDVFRSISEKNLLLPLPVLQMDANPNLRPQNPGW